MGDIKIDILEHLLKGCYVETEGATAYIVDSEYKRLFKVSYNSVMAHLSLNIITRKYGIVNKIIFRLSEKLLQFRKLDNENSSS